MTQPTAKDIYSGAIIYAGHMCLTLGQQCTVREDSSGRYYVDCGQGRHYIHDMRKGFTREQKL